MSEHHDKPKTDVVTRILRWVVGFAVGLAALVLVGYGLAYTLSPAAIRHPATTHYHFRLDLIMDGKPVDFGADKFQTTYTSDICSAAITKQPVHFHDNENQFVHVHWAGITGGLILKNYGWNVIGGLPDALGYRFDQGSGRVLRVGAHGKNLPKPASGDHQYVYVGDAEHYESRSWEAFVNEKLPTFFHTEVTSHDHSASIEAVPAQAEAAQLNHVLGSVIIFVQKDKPTDAQVKARFQKLLPLPTSQCSG